MKDMLEKLFEIQIKHNERWQDKERFVVDRSYRNQVMKDFILGLTKQTSSLLETFGWSNHLLNKLEDVHNAKIQLIDLSKYVFAFFTMLGGTPEEFADLFVKKSDELDERWNQNDLKLNADNRVVIFDIDGVIADYSTGYESFLRNEIGLVERPAAKRTSYSFFEYFGITRQQEEKYNEEFIQSGGFGRLPIYPGVTETIAYLKSLGIKVVLVTARPNWIYRRIAMDTQTWLRENGVEYDLLLWNKDKADAIINNIFPANVLWMIEDRDKHAIEVTHIGVDVLLVNKPYNQQAVGNRIIRISDLAEVKYYTDERIKGLI